MTELAKNPIFKILCLHKNFIVTSLNLHKNSTKFNNSNIIKFYNNGGKDYEYTNT